MSAGTKGFACIFIGLLAVFLEEAEERKGEGGEKEEEGCMGEGLDRKSVV